MRITSTAAGEAADQGYWAQATFGGEDRLAVTEGASYTLSAYFKKVGVIGGWYWLDIDWYSHPSEGGYVSTSFIDYPVSDGAWGQRSLTATVPAGVTHGVVFVGFYTYLESPSSMLVDDVYFQQNVADAEATMNPRVAFAWRERSKRKPSKPMLSRRSKKMRF